MNTPLLHGFCDVISESELEEKLKSKKKLRIKWGADPSAPDIHLGHSVVIRKLRQFQEMGHEIIFLIGNFTATIGDPTGKSKTRKTLTAEEVKANALTYQDQVFKILDRSKTTVVYNADWLDKLSSRELIHLTAQYNVARMLERDDFHKRFTSQQSISLHEFLYPLLQGYDSVHLKADIEIGGTDQKFNLLVGRQLQKEFDQTPQVVLTMPILEGLDGIQKMSKSLNNQIGLTDRAQDMFGKIMSIPDNLILKYYELLTSVPPQQQLQMKEDMAAGLINPRNLKAELGKLIVSDYHGSAAGAVAEEQFNQLFRNKDIPDDIPEIILPKDKPLTWTLLLATTQLAPSNKEAQRLIAQGAVTVNGNKLEKPLDQADTTQTLTIKAGKRRFIKVIWE